MTTVPEGALELCAVCGERKPRSCYVRGNPNCRECRRNGSPRPTGFLPPAPEHLSPPPQRRGKVLVFPGTKLGGDIRCQRCGLMKGRDQFVVGKGDKAGQVMPWCKPCRIKHMKAKTKKHGKR